MPMTTHPIYIAGQATQPNTDLEVHDKFTGESIARCAVAVTTTVDEAISGGAVATKAMRTLPIAARRDAITALKDAIAHRHEEFSQTLTAEVGKPIIFSRAEVDRTLDTLRLSMDACEDNTADVPLSMQGSPSGAGYEATTKRFPIGLCSLITPFNFPLNLLAHKIGPAIAAGCPFICKPSEKTPITTMLVAEILSTLDLPPGAWSIINALGAARDMLTTDPRIRFLSFTGSGDVGWNLRARCGSKRIALELGGNASCILDEGADLDYAIERIALGAYSQAGQSCISVQRVICHESIFAQVRDRLANRIATIKAGDPRDESIWIGPMIDEAAAVRVESWINDAISNGANAIVHGSRTGSLVTPSLLTNVAPDQNLNCKEAFGPVATLSAFTDLDRVIDQINRSEFGLQTGLFTPDTDRACRAYESLEMGGVVINDIPTTRIDSLPYGGVKASGLGREGVRWAMESMTEPRLLLTRKG